MILSLCDNADVLSVMRIVKIVITIIKIAVPIILILSLMINYLIAVKSDDFEALSKANKQASSKVIAAVLVFLIPTFIEVVSDISSYDTNNYADCFANANKEYIENLKESNARIYLGYARESLRKPDLLLAINMINKVDNEAIKNELINESKEIEELIKDYENKKEDEKQSHQSDGGSINISPGQSANIENTIGVYYYEQCDSRWGDIVYDTGNGSGERTLCSSSCGYTSLAMIAAGLNNNSSINPYTVVKDLRNLKDGEKTSRGYGAAPWNELTGSSYISRYNLTAQEVGRSDIESTLKAGKPVLAEFPGHYMVLSYSSSGKVVLLDPYTKWSENNKKSGEYNSVSDIESIYGNIKVSFSYAKK